MPVTKARSIDPSFVASALTMTTEQAAAALGSGPHIVRRMCEDGRLTAVRVGTHWRVSGTSVRKMIGLPAAPAQAQK